MKKRILKGLRVLTGVVAFVGFFVIVGAEGSSQLDPELGIYKPLSYYAHQGVIGLVMFGGGVFATHILTLAIHRELKWVILDKVIDILWYVLDCIEGRLSRREFETYEDYLETINEDLLDRYNRIEERREQNARRKENKQITFPVQHRGTGN